MTDPTQDTADPDPPVASPDGQGGASQKVYVPDDFSQVDKADLWHSIEDCARPK